MQRLIDISEKKQKEVSPGFQRYLANQIDWSQKLILILGHRGTGKTTMLIQQLKKVNAKSIYISLDDIYFEDSRLIHVIEQLYSEGYRSFFLDEAHRYTHWSIDLKLLYDNFTDAQFVVTGSSILSLSKGKADLSRRAVVYHLSGLSLREFLELEDKGSFPVLPLENLIKDHEDISLEISDQIDVLSLFDKYLNYGYYPFYQEGIHIYTSRLLETIQVVLEMDLGPFEELSHQTIRNMKKLLLIISESVPCIPNISKLAERLAVSRNTILKILDLLEQAHILILLRSHTRGVSFLQKPEKIYLQNTNLAFAISDASANRGNIRETFFLSQLAYQHEVTMPKFGDFMVNEAFTFEIGGPQKSKEQVHGVPNAFIVSDGITYSRGNKIPLWLFGFLY